MLTKVIQLGIHYSDSLPKIPGFRPPFFRIRLKNKVHRLLAGFVLSVINESVLEDPMLAIYVENLSDLAVVECKGGMIRDESVFKLRDVVLAQTAARIIVLDLSEVGAIGGGGLQMLAFLDRWAREHGIQFKLFSPSRAVLEGLVQNRSILNFEIASFHEMMRILAMQDDAQYALAA
jgi:anti-anti-sigma regulatory factor